MKSIEKYFNKLQLTLAKRSRIYSKLAKFIENGVPLNLALDTLYQHVSKGGKKNKKIEAIAINNWRISIRNGHSFSQALSPWVNPEEVSVLNAGEISGRLDTALANVIEMGKAKKEIKKALFGITYPIVLICCLMFYLYIFGVKVVPAFEKILPVDKWSGTGLEMEYLSQFVLHEMIYYVLAFVVFVIAIIISLPRWIGRFRTYFDVMPIFSTYRTIIGCQFLIAFCSLLQAGVATPEIINVLNKFASPWYRERLLKTRTVLLGGAPNIGEALAKTGLRFPSDEIIIDLRTYAALDGFELMLNDLSRQWLGTSVENIKSQMEVFKNIIIIMIGLTFMWIVDGMFALQQLISTSAM